MLSKAADVSWYSQSIWQQGQHPTFICTTVLMDLGGWSSHDNEENTMNQSYIRLFFLEY